MLEAYLDQLRSHGVSQLRMLRFCWIVWANITSYCRMAMKFFSGLREALNWRSLWMLTVIVSRWSSILLHFCLMVVGFVGSRHQMRSLPLSFPIYSCICMRCTIIHVSWVVPNLLLISFATVRDGRWGWDRCYASPNRWCCCLIYWFVQLLIG